MFKSILLSICCAACVFGQTESANGNAVAIQIRDPGALAAPNAVFFSAFRGSTSPVPGAPYSAQSSTQRVQMLFDGNRIEQTETATVARDSQGRVRTESVPAGMALPGGDPPHLISIDDPVAGVRYTLDPTNKIAFKISASKMPPPPDKQVTGNVTIAARVAVPGPDGPGPVIMSARTLAEPDDADVSKVDLGTETMEGVQVQGTRITRTIPAGSMGNEQPIIITTETWYSPALKVLVMSKSSDPRIGETTYTLTNVQRSEPPASLFQVPADYTIKEGPGQFFFQKINPPKE